MRKIQKFSELQPTIGFTELDIYQDYRHSFEQSALGALYHSFPFRELAKELHLKERPLGRKSYFSPEGKVALMVLKNYSSLSDKFLIEQLNSNLHLFHTVCSRLVPQESNAFCRGLYLCNQPDKEILLLSPRTHIHRIQAQRQTGQR